jgi:hypothetical protein
MRPALAAEALVAILSDPEPMPVFLWGAPGIGKSDIIRQVAAALHRQVIDERAATLDPTDLRGIPDLQDGLTHWRPPAFFPHDPAATSIIFLDELPQSPTLVQNACLQLVLDRRLAEYKVPAGVSMVAAGNRQGDRAGANRLTTALANRFVTHLDLEVSNDDWQAWAAANGVPPVVRNFLKFKPDLLFQFDPEDADASRSFPTPRSWVGVGRLVNCFANHAKRDTLLVDVVGGAVGRGAAAEFLAFDRIWMHLPKPSEVLADPAGAPIPTSPDVLIALTGALAESVRNDGSAGHVGALLEYAGRLSGEHETATVRDAWACNPTIRNLPAVQRWVADHRELIGGTA